MQYLAAEDTQTMKKIGINVIVLVGVTALLVVAAALLT
jgi:precorrin-4 methylase